MKAQQDYAYVNLERHCIVCGKKGTVAWLNDDNPDEVYDTCMCAINPKTKEVTEV